MDKMKKEEPWCKKRPSFFADDGESQSNCYFLSSTLIATNVHVRCFDTSVITLPVPTPARPPARPRTHASPRARTETFQSVAAAHLEKFEKRLRRVFDVLELSLRYGGTKKIPAQICDTVG